MVGKYLYSASPWSGIPWSGMITMKRYGFLAKKWSPWSGIRIFKLTREVFELKTVSELQISRTIMKEKNSRF